MKAKNKIIQSEIPDFVEEHDIFGLIKTKRIEVHKTSKSIINIAAPRLKMKYASFGDRLNAFLIDIIILFTFLSVLDMLTKTFLPSLNGIQIQNFAVILGTSLIWILYNGIFESSKYQATIGELILKIKVADIQGKRLSVRKALSRNIVAAIAILPLGFGIWSIAIDSRKQGWHDKWLDCYVIKS
jgi:uncharacterized RDD family membrane protein YckC